MNSKINHEERGNVMSLFPVPVVTTNIGRKFTEDELRCLLNISMKEKGNSANHQSKDFYLFDTFAEELNDIKSFCEHELERYLKEIEGIDTDRATLRITQSWLNRTKPSEYHLPHDHPNSYLSSVFYISCLPNDHINLNNRMYGSFNTMRFLLKKTTAWNSDGFRQDVTEGDLIIFPSWMMHNVDENKTDKERISLSFNTFPIGELGEYHGATHLKL